MALLLAPLLKAENLLGTVPTPQDLVERMGLYPGEVYVEGLDCSLTRKPQYHRLDDRPRNVLYPSAEQARAGADPLSTPQLEKQVLLSLVRAADYRGSDVRLDSGELFRPAAWPRRAIDPGKWTWHKLVAH